MMYFNANGKILKLLEEDKGLCPHKYEVVNFFKWSFKKHYPEN